MAEEQVDDAALPAGGLQRRQTRRAGAGRQGRPGRQAAERENPRRDAEAGQGRGGVPSLCGRPRTQTVIDDEGKDRSAFHTRPICGEDGDRQAVRAPGDGEPKPGRRAEGSERAEERGEFRCCNWLGQQPSR